MTKLKLKNDQIDRQSTSKTHGMVTC